MFSHGSAASMMAWTRHCSSMKTRKDYEDWAEDCMDHVHVLRLPRRLASLLLPRTLSPRLVQPAYQERGQPLSPAGLVCRQHVLRRDKYCNIRILLARGDPFTLT